jgi:hypothetical protein
VLRSAVEKKKKKTGMSSILMECKVNLSMRNREKGLLERV